MRGAPSLLQTVLALSLLDFALVAWAAPPDPFTQLRWVAVGLVVATGLAAWFVRDGYRRLGGTVADVWLFVACLLGVLAVGSLAVPDPVLTPLRSWLLAAVAALSAGWLAFAARGEPVRSALSRGGT